MEESLIRAVFLNKSSSSADAFFDLLQGALRDVKITGLGGVNHASHGQWRPQKTLIGVAR